MKTHPRRSSRPQGVLTASGGTNFSKVRVNALIAADLPKDREAAEATDADLRGLLGKAAGILLLRGADQLNA